MSRYHENADRFVSQTFTKKKAKSRHHHESLKTLVKFIGENHTDEIMYVRLVADEPSKIQHCRKSLSTWTTQQKN